MGLYGVLMKPSPTPQNQGGLPPDNRGANWGDPRGAIIGGLYPSKKGSLLYLDSQCLCAYIYGSMASYAFCYSLYCLHVSSFNNVSNLACSFTNAAACTIVLFNFSFTWLLLTTSKTTWLGQPCSFNLSRPSAVK
jgi:hypothetical protein